MFKVNNKNIDSIHCDFTANIYLLKVNNKKKREICSKLTIKIPERRQ